MRYLLGLFFFLFFSAFMVTGGIWALFKLFTGMGFPMSDKTTDRLVARLRNFLQKTRTALVPWDAEMLSLLSLNKSKEQKNSFFGRPKNLVYDTIYHEPVLTMVEQKAGKLTLLVAQTSDKEFVFRRKPNQTEIWVNGKPLGVLVDGVLLAPGSQSKMLARLERNTDESQFPVELAGGQAAAISNPQRSTGPNPRALTLLRNLNAEEENAVLALSVLEMANAAGT